MLSPKTREMISKREKYLGGAYRLFYRKPLNIVRGEGDYLWDDEGNKYLVCVLSVFICSVTAFTTAGLQCPTPATLLYISRYLLPS